MVSILGNREPIENTESVRGFDSGCIKKENQYGVRYTSESGSKARR